MHIVDRMKSVNNPHQGPYTKALCVCTVGMLRSATLAEYLRKEPFNFNTRAVGVDKQRALIPLDPVHLVWADIVYCMDYVQKSIIDEMAEEFDLGKMAAINLNIPDDYDFRSWDLIYLFDESL